MSKCIRERMSGNEAVAYAIRQVNPDVMPAFPLTPSTEIPQTVSAYLANGDIENAIALATERSGFVVSQTAAVPFEKEKIE